MITWTEQRPATLGLSSWMTAYDPFAVTDCELWVRVGHGDDGRIFVLNTIEVYDPDCTILSLAEVVNNRLETRYCVRYWRHLDAHEIDDDPVPMIEDLERDLLALLADVDAFLAERGQPWKEAS